MKAKVNKRFNFDLEVINWDIIKVKDGFFILFITTNLL